MYRAYIAQKKYRVVLDEIKPNSDLAPLYYVAEYFASPDKRNKIVDLFEEKFSKEMSDCDEVWIIGGATVYYNEGMIDSALKYVF